AGVSPKIIAWKGRRKWNLGSVGMVSVVGAVSLERQPSMGGKMKRIGWLVSMAVVAVWLVLVMFVGQPMPAAAGGLPCFLCHGVKFEGSDIAPRVNGTKLTDAEILNQVHNPR